MPCVMQKMQGGRSQGILVVGIPCLHLLPKMLTIVMKNRDCLFSPTWHEEGRNRSCLDLSVHSCPYFLEFEHRCFLPKAIARDCCLGCCSEHCWVYCISHPVTRTWKPHWWLWQSHGFYSSVTHFQRTWILKLFVQTSLRPECSGCLIPVG